MNKILIKEFLEQEYLIHKKSSLEIAKEMNCTKPTILKYLSIYNIPKRTGSESLLNRKLRGKISFKFIKGLIADKDWLYNQYIINKKTAKEIAKISGTITSTVYKHLVFFQIERRKPKEYVKDNWKKYLHPMFGKKRPDVIKRNQSRHLIGNKNGNWQGGISKLPYAFEFTEELKEQIRQRDNYRCQLCNFTNEEHLITYDESLPIHHIDYNKKNCGKDNLITTCKQCNTRANFNRDYWKELYRNKIAQPNKEAVKK